MDEQKVVNIRAAAKEALADWFYEKVIAPHIKLGKELGMNDAEINLGLNQSLFDAFSGLHGFPKSQRPK